MPTTAPNLDSEIAAVSNLLYLANCRIAVNPAWWKATAEGEAITREKRELLARLDMLRSESRIA